MFINLSPYSTKKLLRLIYEGRRKNLLAALSFQKCGTRRSRGLTGRTRRGGVYEGRQVGTWLTLKPEDPAHSPWI